MPENTPFESEESHTYALSPIPENIGEFAGKWTLIRERAVVAAEDEFDDLMRTGEYNPETDALYFVPPPGDQYYLQKAA